MEEFLQTHRGIDTALDSQRVKSSYLEGAGWAMDDCTVLASGIADNGLPQSFYGNAITNALHYPLLDYTLRKSQQTRVCCPHIFLDLHSTAYESPALEIKKVTEKIRDPKQRLSRMEKTAVSLSKMRDRVPLTIAYAVNRCRREPGGGYEWAAVLLTVEPENSHVLHSEVLMARVVGRKLRIRIYDPNGSEEGSNSSARTVGKYAADIAERGLCTGVDEVEPIQFMGEGIQTILGEWIINEIPGCAAGSYRVTKRGYPICKSIVLWILTLYAQSVIRVSSMTWPGGERLSSRRKRWNL